MEGGAEGEGLGRVWFDSMASAHQPRFFALATYIFSCDGGAEAT